MLKYVSISILFCDEGKYNTYYIIVDENVIVFQITEVSLTRKLLIIFRGVLSLILCKPVIIEFSQLIVPTLNVTTYFLLNKYRNSIKKGIDL